MTIIIPYAFRTTAPSDPYMQENGDPNTFSPFTTGERQVVAGAFADVSRLVDIIAYESSITPTIEFDNYDILTAGVAAFTDGHFVHVDSNYQGNGLPPGQLIVHEMGHTLSLPHSNLPQNETVMAAFSVGPFQDKFRAADIWHLANTIGTSVNPFVSDTTYVQALYEDFLGRSADTGGLNAQLSALANGTTRLQLMGAFAHSAEYLATHAWFD